MSRHPINLDDYRRLARRRLPRLVFDYVDGAEDELSLRRNRSAFASLSCNYAFAAYPYPPAASFRHCLPIGFDNVVSAGVRNF
jgi:hypothetical protein